MNETKVTSTSCLKCKQDLFERVALPSGETEIVESHRDRLKTDPTSGMPYVDCPNCNARNFLKTVEEDKGGSSLVPYFVEPAPG